MFMFFDTETTGIPRRYDAPVTDTANWPRVVQIAWVTADGTGQELKSYVCIIRPNGYQIPPEAARIHGITTELARRDGVEIAGVLDAFTQDAAGAKVLVAHNMLFDEGIVGAEFVRAGRPDPFAKRTRLCTMRSSTEYCRIPGGPRGYKWPTLEQLHQKLFKTLPQATHEALADVRTCAKCFFELRRLGVMRV